MNIKKILKAGFASMVLASGFAVAMDDMKFYVGADANLGSWSYNNSLTTKANAAPFSYTGGFKKRNTSLDLNVGTKFNEYFGAELGYGFFQKTKLFNSAGGNPRVKASNLHLDVMGYAPVADEWNLVGALGVGRMNTKVTSINNNTKHKTGVRVGAGVQYAFDDCLAARLMARYQKVGNSSNQYVKSLKSIGLGLTYSFM